MTSTTATPTDPSTAAERDPVPTHHTGTDPRELFARTVTLGASLVAGVRADQLDLPTPCTEFAVRDVLAHLVEVLESVEILGRGGDPIDPGRTAPVVPDEGWASAWRDAAEGAQAAWVDDAVLGRTMVLPWMTASGTDTLVGYVSELTVHLWDVATAVGAHPSWDDESVEAALAKISGVLPAEGRLAQLEAIKATMPDEYRDFPAPFAEAVAVAADAPPIDRLVAYCGRQP